MNRDIDSRYFMAVAVFLVFLAGAALTGVFASHDVADLSIRCIPVTLEVTTLPTGFEVFVGTTKKVGEHGFSGHSPFQAEFLAVVVERPGKRKPLLGFLDGGVVCPDAADFRENELNSVTRYFSVDTGHSGYKPIRNRKRKLLKPKQVLQALNNGDEKIEISIEFTLEDPSWAEAMRLREPRSTP